jgi:hypothetical protein
MPWLAAGELQGNMPNNGGALQSGVKLRIMGDCSLERNLHLDVAALRLLGEEDAWPWIH